MEGQPEGGEWRQYLCYFMHRLLDFRLAELRAVADMVTGGAFSRRPGSIQEPEGGCPHSPFWYIRLPSDEAARQVAANCVLVKALYELWGHAATFEGCLAAAERFPGRHPWTASGRGLRVVVDAWGHKVPQERQLALIERLYTLDFKGPIRLSDPDVTYRLLIAAPPELNIGLPRDIVAPHVYFGREVARSDRHVIARYALSQRAYIGPTSMDTEMAFVMAALAQVRRGSLVYDPFVGTGSCLVAAAVRGAHTLGGDIDIRVVREGKLSTAGEECTVWSNFEAYGLPAPLGLLRCDNHRPPFREGLSGFLDAIVCDPPYGVRAGGRKSVAKPYTPRGDPETHIISTDPYPLGECLEDMVASAALLLRVGGRLVFFQPSLPGVAAADQVPGHTAMRLVCACEQSLTRRYGRRLVCLEKERECGPGEARAGVRLPPRAAQEVAGTVFAAPRPDQPLYDTKFRGKLC